MSLHLSPDSRLLLRVVTRDGAVQVGHMLEGPPDQLILKTLATQDSPQPVVRAIPVASITAVATRVSRAGRHRLFQLACAAVAIAALHMLTAGLFAPVRPMSVVFGGIVGAMAGSVLLFNVQPSDTWYRWEDEPVAAFFETELGTAENPSPHAG